MLNSSKYAARFGDSVDRGFEGGCLAFPFMYTFVNRLQDRWDQVKGASGYDNLQDLGPVIPATGYRMVVVTLDADHLFKLLYVKYTAYRYFDTPPKHFAWHYEAPGFFMDTDSPLAITDPITRWVTINVSVSHNGRYLYGQQNGYAQSASLLPNVPVLVPAIQGNENGWGQIRMPYLLPRNGALRFEVYNGNDFPVVVGAMIYGMKVRL